MIDDPLQSNDWQIKKFIRIIVAIQVTMLGVVGLSVLGVNLPILRQAIGFIYLTLVPGVIILRIFRLHKLGTVKAVLYTIGISLAFDMFLGFIINSLYPHFGITKPISTWSLMCTMTMIQVFLLALAYKRDKSFISPNHLSWRKMFSGPSLFLILLPMLAVLGTQIVNIYHSNIILMALIIIIAVIPVLVGFTRFTSPMWYPLAIFMVALALLYHNSLISNYLTGSDGRLEYYYANLVGINSYWDSSINHPYNGMLSLVVLAPTYSKICSLELTYVFKIIYPLLFSFVPLGIYEVCRRQISAKVAFLSTFFFMASATFFEILPSLARQEIAEIFLILIVLLIVDKAINLRTRRIIILLFGCALIVSHYSMSYIFMVLLVVSLFIIFLGDRLFGHKRSQKLVQDGFQKSTNSLTMVSQTPTMDRTITPAFTMFFIVAGLSWYLYQTGSISFTSAVIIGKSIATSFFSEFLRSQTSQALTMITTLGSPLHEVTKYLYLLTQLLIAIGIFDLLIYWKRGKYDKEYSAFSLVSFFLAVAAIGVPYLSSVLNTDRFYQITLIFLAPFCITGTLAINSLFSKKKGETALVIKSVSLVLAVFFLFSSGFVYEIAKDNPLSISLSQNSIIKFGDGVKKAGFYNEFSIGQDVFSAKWMSKYTSKNSKIFATYSDIGQAYTLQGYGMISPERISALTTSTKEIPNLSYIYLQYNNVVLGLGLSFEKIGGNVEKQFFSMGEISPLLVNTDQIYSNGGSEILFDTGN